MATVVAEVSSVAWRLAQLGLAPNVLRDAVAAGELERVSCTDLHPVGYPGYTAWGTTFARLAFNLKPFGWEKRDFHNLPLVTHPERLLAIAVSSGNEFTGSKDIDVAPSTMHTKGPMFGVRVTQNQPSLFHESEFRPKPPADAHATWILLFHSPQVPRDERSIPRITRCELSMPEAIDPFGWVVAWSERIILEPVTLDDLPRREAVPDLGPSPKIEVKVTRR